MEVAKHQMTNDSGEKNGLSDTPDGALVSVRLGCYRKLLYRALASPDRQMPRRIGTSRIHYVCLIL